MATENQTELPAEEKTNAEPTQAKSDKNVPTSSSTSKGGAALGLVAILIALGVGGASYYFGKAQLDQTQGKIVALQTQLDMQRQDPNDRAEIAQILVQNQAAQQKIAQLEQALNTKSLELNQVQAQIQQLAQQNANEKPSDWLLSQADFLLNTAQQKLILDDDIATSVSLLEEADKTLAQVSSAQAAEVRRLIAQDLKQLNALNPEDQNSIMQQLSQLANNVDELPALNVNFDAPDDQKLSDNWADWKENAEKSATSFLNHFIRISPKQGAEKKELLAPNQDIYLRENIRLRLQLAIMAVPRQQNELYKQSLEAVASWVRSYYDTNAQATKVFLASVDELAEKSLYIDLPQLQSPIALNQYLHRIPQNVKKIEIETDKAVAELPNAKTPGNEAAPQADNAPQQ